MNSGKKTAFGLSGGRRKRTVQSRREFLGMCCSAAVSPFVPASWQDEPLLSNADRKYLHQLAKDTVKRAELTRSKETLGFTAISPGGSYPAFWIRDFSMAAGCGVIASDVVKSHLLCAAKAQNGGRARELGSRATIPPYSIPDHIRPDGGAVFYPGTYSAGDDQGGEPFGKLPPIDDHYELIHLAFLVWRKEKDAGFFEQDVEGTPLLDRLEAALDCAVTDPSTGLVVTSERNRAVGFGFCDTVYLTGSLLFPSLLRYRALDEISKISKGCNRTKRLEEWSEDRKRIRHNLIKTFARSGWLKAATEIGQQPDVWGTVYALYLDALQEPARYLDTVVEAVRSGIITYKGAVRHVPTDFDFSPTSAWQRTAGVELNRYQNGAYWHVPSGHLASVVWRKDKALARGIVEDMVQHFKDEDYREHQGRGAPWECLHPSDNYRQNPVYMASVTWPLEALTSYVPS